ncbi:hypothetical protein EMIT0158MI4_100134 [Burkholderia ambifaria]
MLDYWNDWDSKWKGVLGHISR